MATNEVYDLVPLPPGRRAVGCKWVFTLKRNELGEVTRHKARLVAKGFAQREGIDYVDTFAPVANFTAIRLILAIAAAQDLEVEQMDVATAFLYGKVEEELYMQQPEGYAERGRERMVWRLRRGIYGLKQAPRMWNERIDEVFVGDGFTRCERDTCIYVKWREGKPIYVVVYVDDLLLVSGDAVLLRATKDLLKRTFKMKDLGPVKHCLGLVVTRDRASRRMWINQEMYLRETADALDLGTRAIRGTPMETGLVLHKDTDNDPPPCRTSPSSGRRWGRWRTPRNAPGRTSPTQWERWPGTRRPRAPATGRR
jgi:hypothetical protein